MTTTDELDGRPDAHLMRVAAVLVLGVLAPLLDTTIVNVALRTLGADLHATVSAVQWVSTGYLLAMATAIPVSGWATERHGARRMWLLALTLFLAGSAACGLAWNLGSLIAFRAVQGAGTGLLLPIMQTVLFRAAGGRPAARTLALISLPVVIGPILGPVLGGLLVDVHWRWIFYVNAPVCLVAIALARRVLPVDDARPGTGRLDVTGLLLLSPGLAGLVYGLSRAGGAGGFAQAGVLVPLAGGLLLAVAFGAHALRRPGTALVDLRLFADRWFATCSAVLFLAGLSMFAAMLLLPLYYQQVRGEGVVAAGLLLAPQGLGTALARLAVGLVDRLTDRTVILAGIALTALGTWPFALADAHTALLPLALALVVRGLGLGVVMMAVMLSAYAGLTREQIPHASSLTRIVQQLGGSFGTALLAVVLQRRLAGAAGAAGVAAGFGHTFTWALALTVLALVPALAIPRGSSRAARPGPTAPDSARQAPTAR